MILIFNIFILLIALIAVYLKGNNLINKLQEYYLPYIIEVIVLAFFGYVAPKIPYNRYVGLRLHYILFCLIFSLENYIKELIKYEQSKLLARKGEFCFEK